MSNDAFWNQVNSLDTPGKVENQVGSITLLSDGNIEYEGSYTSDLNASQLESIADGGFTSIYAGGYGNYAAQHADGSLLVFGYATNDNEEIGTVELLLNSKIEEIHFNYGAGGAKLDNNDIKTWGHDGYEDDVKSQFNSSPPEVNTSPYDIALTENNFDENITAGRGVASLITTDDDEGDYPSYSFVTTLGSNDNDDFTLQGNELRIKESPDYELKSEYKIEVRTTDSGGLNYEELLILKVNDLLDNRLPTDISVSDSSIEENIAAGSEIATLQTADPDSNDTHTYALVNGSGDTDNSSFTISGNKVKINDSPDFETKSSYNIRLSTTDSGNYTYQEQITLSVNDLLDNSESVTPDNNVAPTDISITASSFDENIAAGSEIATLQTTDLNSNDTHTYALVNGSGDTDNSSFTISGNKLKIKESPDFETKSNYNIRLSTTDSGNCTYEEAFAFFVNDLNETSIDNDQTYSSALDSANLINELFEKSSRTTDDEGSISRNADHLKGVIANNTWSEDDQSPLLFAISRAELLVGNDTAGGMYDPYWTHVNSRNTPGKVENQVGSITLLADGNIEYEGSYTSDLNATQLESIAGGGFTSIYAGGYGNYAAQHADGSLLVFGYLLKGTSKN